MADIFCGILTPFCFWNTIVWYLVDPPSAFIFFHFCLSFLLDLSVPIYIWNSVRAQLRSTCLFRLPSHFTGTPDLFCSFFFFLQVLPTQTSSLHREKTGSDSHQFYSQAGDSHPNVDTDCPSQTPGLAMTMNSHAAEPQLALGLNGSDFNQ